MSYRDQLNHWAVVIHMENCQRRIVGRYRNRNDADGHLKLLRTIPPGHKSVVFIPPNYA